ncbi:MAG: helix-turn-helix transcriptional regulator [Thermoleophilia bacterium]
MTTTAAPGASAGQLLREWRERRNLSQLALASGAAVSTRHLSYIETGKSRPSREMLLHLAERLDVPLRERNRLLLAGGFAPVYGERSLESDELAVVREALERLLAAHEPYPALVVDRHWNVVLANRAVATLVQGVAPHLLEPPLNALRATLHPEGMAPAIENLDEWCAHILARLERELAATGDPALAALRDELLGYPGVAEAAARHEPARPTDILVPLVLRTPAGRRSLFGTQTVFGTPTDVTLAELSIEAFYPADRETAAALAAAVGDGGP